MTDSHPKWDLRRYFVDEAGDPTIFGRGGKRVLPGTLGCSRHFTLGFVEVDEPRRLEASLSQLRIELFADPKLAAIPSMQPVAKKTALAFHAKDDHPSVRSRVFEVLSKQSFHFYAVVRDKGAVIDDIRATQRLVPSYRYKENALYDGMTARLLRDRLHVEECEIVFARRGASDRTVALKRSIEEAKARFAARWRRQVDRPHSVAAAHSQEHAGLQLADYCLWALQRLLARGEEDCWALIRPKAVEVTMLDYGDGPDQLTFTPSAPLTGESLRKGTGDIGGD